MGDAARWTYVEDDFVLGSCSRRLIGYIAETADGTWEVFNDDAQMIGAFDALGLAQDGLWATHRPVHLNECQGGCRWIPLGRGTQADA